LYKNSGIKSGVERNKRKNMSTFLRIVCTEQVPYGNPPACARIVSVGINSNGGDLWERRLAVEEVFSLMRQGVMFYTKGLVSGRTAFVEPYWCSQCKKYHIRSKADAVKDNNLDSLGYCLWKAAA
jgi:hypothetical protein